MTAERDRIEAELPEKELPEVELDADAPSAPLAAATKEAAERLVPRERDFAAIEERLLARIDASLDADAPSEALEAIVRESRTHLVPSERDFAAIERKVLARAGAGKVAPLGVRWRGVAAVVSLAAAAAAVVFAGPRPASWETASRAARSGGVLGAHEGSVRIGGATAMIGQAAMAGDRVEVGGGRAVFEQAGLVTWGLEPESRVRLARTEGGLVLALERGAVEAQVAPVASGEAFAVDVADSDGHVARIAVHGTHLRVARAGDHVVVDLTEGVVTVGRAPRAGSTYGALVTAPAHVELDVANADVVRVDHATGAVRPAVALAFADKPAAAAPAPIAIGAVDIEAPRPEPRAPQAAPVRRPAGAPEPAGAQAEPDALAKVEAAVRLCFAQGASQLPEGSPEVHVSVSPTLTLPVEADGAVHTFVVDPPLSVGEQQCVAQTVFALRFPDGGKTVRLRLDLSR